MAAQEFSLFGMRLDEAQFQVPQDFKYGKRTAMSSRDIPQTSGNAPKRVSQITGVYPKTMKWSARFLGVSAEDNFAYLESLQEKGLLGPFVVGRRRWDVIIKDIEATQRSRYDIGFEVELEPQADRSGVTPNTNKGDTHEDLADPTTAIMSLPGTSPSGPQPAIDGQLSDLGDAITAAQPENLAPTSTLLALQGQANTLLQQVDTLSASIETAVDPNSVQLYLWLDTVRSAVSGYGQGIGNLLGATKPQLSVNGGTLFGVAAQQYGDAMRAFDIGAVNGIRDPWLPGPTTLTLPRIAGSN